MYSQTVSFFNLLLALTILLAAAACTMSSVDDGALVEQNVSDDPWYVSIFMNVRSLIAVLHISFLVRMGG